MTYAPERIWTTGNAMTGSWNNDRVAINGLDQTQYVRADIVKGLIEASGKANEVLRRVQEDPLWRTNDNSLWPDMCESSRLLHAALTEARGEQQKDMK